MIHTLFSTHRRWFANLIFWALSAYLSPLYGLQSPEEMILRTPYQQQLQLLMETQHKLTDTENSDDDDNNEHSGGGLTSTTTLTIFALICVACIGYAGYTYWASSRDETLQECMRYVDQRTREQAVVNGRLQATITTLQEQNQKINEQLTTQFTELNARIDDIEDFIRPCAFCKRR